MFRKANVQAMLAIEKSQKEDLFKLRDGESILRHRFVVFIHLQVFGTLNEKCSGAFRRETGNVLLCNSGNNWTATGENGQIDTMIIKQRDPLTPSVRREHFSPISCMVYQL